MSADTPVVPQYITVHLGKPAETAENVRIPFPEYIKNVASSEIYPTWPSAAIHANILAQITYALNRIYTEFYPSQGYSFDITNSTAYDQMYIEGRDYFDNISKLVDEVFNDYVIRQGYVQPLFTSYCNGTTVTCGGLSQWGTVPLAENGLGAYEILQNYYGDDINIVFNAPVRGVLPSYPGVPLRLGSVGEPVRTVERELNRIGDNYPSIPKVKTDGFFGVETEEAVKVFQHIFNLTVDGIVGKGTWYQLKYIYNGVKSLSDLVSEGLKLDEVQRQFPRELNPGENGTEVGAVQYFLKVLSRFDNRIPAPAVTEHYDEATKAAVTAFQNAYGLPATGNVDAATWNRMEKAYRDAMDTVTDEPSSDELFPGRFLSLGMTGNDVQDMKGFLRRAAAFHTYINRVNNDNIFDQMTEKAVLAVQKHNAGLEQNGVVGPLTWDRIVQLSKG